jgi:hypothetical protein
LALFEPRRRAWHWWSFADGKIVANDVMSVPDMLQVLGPLMALDAQP